MPTVIEQNVQTGAVIQREMTPEELAGIDPAPPPPAPRWTPLEFIERFTEAEQLAIVSAAMASPPLRLWYDKAMAADVIIADDVRTVAGLQALVDVGLISASRRDQILSAS